MVRLVVEPRVVLGAPLEVAGEEVEEMRGELGVDGATTEEIGEARTIGVAEMEVS